MAHKSISLFNGGVIYLGHSAIKALKINDDIEAPLKNFRFLRGAMRDEVEEFFRKLPEPHRTFAVYRYVECHTMERIAEKMNYSTRNMYCFRQKILEWWAIFLGEEIGGGSGGKGKTNIKFLSR